MSEQSPFGRRIEGDIADTCPQVRPLPSPRVVREPGPRHHRRGGDRQVDDRRPPARARRPRGPRRDVLGRGAAATAYGRRDYVAFWRFALAVCREVRTNGLVPVVPCICLPEQVLAAVDDEVVHVLALLSEPATVRRRIAARTGTSGVPSPESHVELDRRLRDVASVPAPHTWTTHDVTVGDVRSTVAAGVGWALLHAR